MHCTESICLTSGAIRTVYDSGALRILIGYISGQPFSCLLVDTRDGTHLHLPVDDVRPALSTGIRALVWQAA